MPKTFNIPKPPGGTLTCAANQMGVVDVINGEVHARCTTVPTTGTTRSGDGSGRSVTFSQKIARSLAGDQHVNIDTIMDGKLVQDNPHRVPRLRDLGVGPNDEVVTYFFLPGDVKSRL